MGKIQSACEAVLGIVRGVSGIRTAPDSPPSKMSSYPVAICYPGPGTFSRDNASATRKLTTLVLEVHVAYKDLDRDYRVLLPLADAVTDALLADITIDGAVDTILANDGIGFSGLTTLGYPPDNTIGFRWEIPTKIRE